MAEQAQHSAEPTKESAPTPEKESTVKKTVGKAGKVLRAVSRRISSAHGLESGVLDTTQNLSREKIRRREKVVNMAWYAFLIIMLYIGGSATLGWIFNGGYRAGYNAAERSSTVPPAPIATSPALVSEMNRVASAIEKIADTKPVPPLPPQVIEKRIEVPIPVSTPAVVQPPSSITDAERRNKALKERLRRRYGIE